MKRYVLVFPHELTITRNPELVLIERRKDDWQQGKLNLTGGSIAPGETVEQAAVRELAEETGLIASAVDVQVLGEIDGGGSGYHVTVCYVPYRPTHLGLPQVIRNLAGGEGQIISMLTASALVDPRLIPNLKLIIPLCQARVRGWKLIPAADDFTWTVALA